MTTMLHGNGAYFYDLGCQGWFGRPAAPNVTAALWSGIKSAFAPFYAVLKDDAMAVNRAGSAESSAAHGSARPSRKRSQSINGEDTPVTMPHTIRLNPEIAVFVDDLSATTWISLNDGGITTALVQEPPIFLSASGCPVRLFLLSDLLVPTADWTHFKLVVFLNPFVMPPSIAEAIAAKLENGNRTLVWQYAPGIFGQANTTRTVDLAAMANLVGFALRQGPGPHDVFTHVPSSPTLSKGFPRNYGDPVQKFDPWFQPDVDLTKPLPTGVEVSAMQRTHSPVYHSHPCHAFTRRSRCRHVTLGVYVCECLSRFSAC
jgi:hypothetical protein